MMRRVNGKRGALTLMALILAACAPIPLMELESDLEASEAALTLPMPTTQDGPCLASGCHAELQDTTRPHPHQSFTHEACLECHIHFHDPATQRLHAQSEIDWCATCHTADTMGATHPVGEGVVDPNTGQMLTCTSACHRQHTAPYPYLLTRAGDGELCLTCHTDWLSQ